jgi:hypothetical protein
VAPFRGAGGWACPHGSGEGRAGVGSACRSGSWERWALPIGGERIPGRHWRPEPTSAPHPRAGRGQPGPRSGRLGSVRPWKSERERGSKPQAGLASPQGPGPRGPGPRPRGREWGPKPQAGLASLQGPGPQPEAGSAGRRAPPGEWPAVGAGSVETTPPRRASHQPRKRPGPAHQPSTPCWLRPAWPSWLEVASWWTQPASMRLRPWPQPHWLRAPAP